MRSSSFLYWLGLAISALVLGTATGTHAQTGLLLDDYNVKFEGEVRAFAGTGGKYYVSGDFRKVNGIEREKIALIHPDESLDASFVPTSLGTGSYPTDAFSAPPTTLYPQPDGTVVTVGGHSTLAAVRDLRRLGPNGKMQPNFGGQGDLYSSMATCISGGKFFHAAILSRSYGGGTSYYRQIFRMDYGSGFNGHNLDPEFPVLRVDGAVNCMLPLPDGRIVIGGSFSSINNIPRRSLAIIHADGTLDSFNMEATNGIGGSVTSLAIGIKDGVPVVYFGGFFTTVTLGSTSVNATNLSFFRPQDPTFISTTFKPVPNQNVNSLLVLPDQTLALAGDFLEVGGQPRKYFAMIRPDGTLMPDFGLAFSARIFVLGYDPADGGRILAGGSFTSVSGVQRHGFARLAVHAITTATASPQSGTVRASARQLDGKVWVGGDFASSASLPRSHLARLNSDTTLDTGVDVAVDGPVHSIACLPDGRVLIGGAFTHLGTSETGHIARLTANGSMDSSFALHADGEVHAMAMRVDGSCYVAGSFSNLGGEARAGIARLQPDGTLDSTFAPVLDGTARCILPLRDGKVLVGGEFAGVNGAAQPWLARLNADGTLDAAFAPQLDGTVNALHLLMNDDILAGGQFTHFLRRLAADGSIRADFTPSLDGPVRVLCGLSDDSTLAGGSFAQVHGQAIYGIVRLANADGTVLPAPSMSWDSPAVSSIHTLLPPGEDGRLLAGGQFTLPLSTPRSSLVAFVGGSLPAAPSPTFSHDTPLTQVLWSRTGSVPQLCETFFDLSTDNGTTWTSLGWASPAAAGWAVPTSMSVLPTNKTFLLRARGVNATGGSGSFYSQTATWTLSTPQIIYHPNSSDINAGQSVILSVYSPSAGATYQWYKNGEAISGATTTQLAITGSLNQEESGTYHVVVSNAYGSTTSRSAVIRVLRLAPVIQVQPGDASVIATGYASFLVSALNGPLSFQWYKDDELIPGATGNELVVRNTGEIFDTPKYKVVVSNLIGSVTSQAATLTVTRPVPTITREPEDVTVVQGQQFSLEVETAWLNITQRYRWYRNGQLVGGSNPGRVFSEWATPDSAGTYRVEVFTPFSMTVSREVQVTVLSAPIVTITEIPARNTAISGSDWQIKTAVTGGGPYSYQWQYSAYDTPYDNWWNNIPGAVSDTLKVDAATPAAPGYYRVQVTNSRGSVRSPRIAIWVLTPVRITSQPENQDLNADDPLTIAPGLQLTGYDMYVHGWPDIQAQWFKDGEEIAGATDWTFARTKSQESDTGEYKLRLTNAAGVVETRTVTITVSPNSPPVVLAPPQPRLLFAGQPLDLSIGASGRHPMTATWRRNGARLPNGHGVVKNKLSTFSRNANLADSGQYSVMLVNDVGTVFSPQAQVVVVDPAAREFIQALDSTVTFPAVSHASGMHVQYQWLKAETPVSDSERISGSTTASLRIASLAQDDAGAYTCRVTFGGNSLTSGSHTLTVLGAVPEITSQNLPQAGLRLPYSALLSATHSASSFKVTGLPPGLILNPATGEISGEPTKAGTFKLQVTASNALGKGVTKTVLLEVDDLPEELAGSYFGVFEHDDMCPGGHVSLTLNRQSSGSGKLQLGTQTFAFKGTFQRNQPNAGRLVISSLKHKDLGVVDLELSLDIRPDGQSEMVATADFGGGWLYALLHKSSWSKTNRPLVYEGYHTFSFASGPAESVASGHSYGSATVSSTGMVTYAGKLADNTAFTASTPLSDDGDTGLFTANDRARNFVNAPRLSFDIPDVVEGQEQNPRRSHRLYGPIRWLKHEETSSKSYPEGFDIRTELLGSRYMEPGTAGTSPFIMNLDAGDELTLYFEGASTGLDFLDEYVTGVLKAGNLATFTPDDFSTFDSLKVTVKPKTGVFTVTAKFNFDLSGFPGQFEDVFIVKRTLTGGGILVSDHEISSGTGRGFMLARDEETGEVLSAPIRLE